MTPEAQRIAIAEACGWSRIVNKSTIQINGLWMGYLTKNPIIGTLEHIPDFCNDLNAMHEAEKVLDGYKWSDYIIELGGFSIEPDREEWKQVCHATAKQKSEAFLKTLGLWIETKPETNRK